MIKLAASDLDGTLLNEKSFISKETIEIIKSSKKEGIRWVAATGRSYKTASRLLEEAGICCDYVLLNGAEFRENDGTLIFQKSIPDESVKRIIAMLLSEKTDFELNTDAGDFSTDCDFCDTARPMPSEKELLDGKRKVQKIFIFSMKSEKLAYIKESVADMQEITLTSSASWNLEITAREADKGSMLKQVTDYYGIKKEEVIVFGDGENDRPMFQTFLHSRAMGNAKEELKQMAEKVIETNVEHGVAKEIMRLLEENGQ